MAHPRHKVGDHTAYIRMTHLGHDTQGTDPAALPGADRQTTWTIQAPSHRQNVEYVAEDQPGDSMSQSCRCPGRNQEYWPTCF